MLKCEAPGCSKEATGRNKFFDPRRSHDEDKRFVLRHYCSEVCMLLIVDELEFQSHYLKLAS